jgi:thiol-disulfide isomerase/thioredoxin
MKPRSRSLLLALIVAGCGGGTDAPSAAPPAPVAAAEPASEPAAAAQPATAEPAAGSDRPAAPDFTLVDLDGKRHTLSALRGKTVVLEWFNPGCPFVKYAHGEGPLVDQARAAAADQIVWLAINSSAPGKQGHGVELNRTAARDWKMPHPVLVDESGAVGKAYGATTTPDMFVIDPEGRIAYRGALDDAPLGRAPSAGGVNYVERALAALAAGQAPDPAETKPYGCSVKYAE